MSTKRKIEDDYIIKVKKSILKETKDTEKKYVTTYKEIKKVCSSIENFYQL